MDSKNTKSGIERAEVVISQKISIRELSECCGIEVEHLYEFYRLGLIDPLAASPELIFDCGTVLKVKKIVRLRQDLGVNLSSMGLVLDLLERVERLERELEKYRR